MNSIKTYNNYAKQAGVGLVEVLVALLVFSIGMLGVASLQVLSTKSSFEAQQRQEAVLLANEMVARMKSSGLTFLEAKDAANYSDFNTTAISDDAPVKVCNTAGSACTSADLAAWDKYIWKRSVKAAAIDNMDNQGLLNAVGCVEFSADADKTIRVVVSWDSMTSMGTKITSDIPAGCRLGTNTQRHVIIRTFI